MNKMFKFLLGCPPPNEWRARLNKTLISFILILFGLVSNAQTFQVGDAIMTYQGFTPTDIVGRIFKVQQWNNTTKDDAWNFQVSPPYITHDGVNGNNFDFQTFGNIFGVELDRRGDIFFLSTSMYGNPSWGIATAPSIFKVDKVTGTASLFYQFPFPLHRDISGTGLGHFPGLGNMTYDTKHDQFFVSNFEDGKIYVIQNSGGTGLNIGNYDYNVADNNINGFAPIGELIWGVAFNPMQDKLFFSVWNNDRATFNATASLAFNEIRSVNIDPTTGLFTGSDVSVFTIPHLTNMAGNNFDKFSNPVSDIEFSIDGQHMLLAEKTIATTGAPSAWTGTNTWIFEHEARELMADFNGSSWVLKTANFFEVGMDKSFGLQYPCQSAGGCDFGYKNENLNPANLDGSAWCTGTKLHWPTGPYTDYIYGLQGTPITGGTHVTSALLDFNNDLTNAADKGKFGDVDVYEMGGCDAMFANTKDITIIEDPLTISANEVWQGKYLIKADITVDGAVLDITNVDLIFDQCVGIQFINGARVRATNSVLRPCDEQTFWKGLKFTGMPASEHNKINSCIFKNASRALWFEESEGEVADNEFYNCHTNIEITNSSFNQPITHNSFVVDDYYPAQNFCEIDTALTTFGINILNSLMLNKISGNQFNNRTEHYYKRSYGILSNLSSEHITNNTFNNMFRTYCKIGDNKEYSYFGENTINTNGKNNQNGYQVSLYNLSIPLYVNHNNFSGYLWPPLPQSDDPLTAVYASECSNLEIKENQITGYELGIRLHSCNSSFVLLNQLENIYSAGIVFDVHSYDLIINCNTIRMDTRNNQNSVGVWDFDNGRYDNVVATNCIYEAAAGMYLLRIPFSANQNPPSIRNNYITNYTLVGILDNGYNGTIGDCNFQPGRNTFVNNNGPIAVEMSASFGSALTESRNYYNGVNNNVVTVACAPPNTPYIYSTASCAHNLNPVVQTNTGDAVIDCNYKPKEGPIEGGEKGGKSIPVFVRDTLLKGEEFQALSFDALLSMLCIKRGVSNNDYEKFYTKILIDYEFKNPELRQALAVWNEWYKNDKPKMASLLSVFNPSVIEGKLAKARLELLLNPDNKTAQTVVNRLYKLANVKDLNTAEGLMVASGKLTQLSSPFLPIPDLSTMSKNTNSTIQPLQVYPNPVRHELQFSYNLTSTDNLGASNGVTYTIYDMQGKTLLTGNLGPMKAMFGIDVQNLSPGPYNLRVMAGDGNSQKALFIKQ